MSMDRWIALLFLAFTVAYGWQAFDYQILPFERNNPFKPNTLPIGLAFFGGILALIVLVKGSAAKDAEGDVLGGIEVSRLREYKLAQALLLIGAMVAYALALRPLGFFASTTLFLAGGGFLLGERKVHMLVLVALIATGIIWYLVQEVLGIFLRPWPGFIPI